MSDDLFGAGVLEVDEPTIVCRHCDEPIAPCRGVLIGNGFAHEATGAEVCGPWPPFGGIVAAFDGSLRYAEPEQ